MGPYETEQAAAAEPMPRAIANLPRLNHPQRATRDLHLGHLSEACANAGVELGAFDLRILTWLANADSVTVQVFLGIFSRAHAAGVRAGEAG